MPRKRGAFSSPVAYRTVGVLGGMGPQATVDFLAKLVAGTPARRDQEHIPLLVRFCPEVPDRTDALARRGPSPLPALLAAARGLAAGGADCLAIPCNTAHAWHAEIAAAVSIPVLHIVDATLRAADPRGTSGPVGLLATTGTLKAGIYGAGAGACIEWVHPDPAAQERQVMAGIRAVKAARLQQGGMLMQQAAEGLVRRGARAIVMGCTEVPIALAGRGIGVPLVDSVLALAQACVEWSTAPSHCSGEPVVPPAKGGISFHPCQSRN